MEKDSGIMSYGNRQCNYVEKDGGIMSREEREQDCVMLRKTVGSCNAQEDRDYVLLRKSRIVSCNRKTVGLCHVEKDSRIM